MIGDRTRASDSERERVAGLLRDAAAEGRLTVDELDARCAQAWAAVTRGELAALLDDLPVPHVVPLFTAADYRIVSRTSHQLEFERETTGLASAPRDVRQALVNLNR